jgi:hypothetical protein
MAKDPQNPNDPEVGVALGKPQNPNAPKAEVDPNIQRALEDLEVEDQEAKQEDQKEEVQAKVNKENAPQQKAPQIQQPKNQAAPEGNAVPETPADIRKMMEAAQNQASRQNMEQDVERPSRQSGQASRQNNRAEQSENPSNQGGGRNQENYNRNQGGAEQENYDNSGQGGQRGGGGQGGGGQGGDDHNDGGQGGGGGGGSQGGGGGGGQRGGGNQGDYDGHNGYEGRNGMSGGRNHYDDFGSPYSQRPNSDSEDGDGRSYGKEHGYQSGDSAAHDDPNRMNSGMMDTGHDDHGNDPVNHASNMQGWNSQLINAKLQVLPGVGEETNLSNALSSISGSLDSIGIIGSIREEANILNLDVASTVDGTFLSQGSIGHSGFDATLGGDISLQNLPKQLTDADSFGGLKSGAEGQSAAQTAMNKGASH